MSNKNVLILTDHTKHSSENSLYDLSIKMLAHSKTHSVDIASRANPNNAAFFSSQRTASLWATPIDDTFAYSKEDHPLSKDFRPIDLKNYELVWLRLPPPLSSEFLDFISYVFPDSIIINNPKAIELTGSKKFLLNFPSVCAPMKVCSTIQEIKDFKLQYPIVLKPYNEYGGRGIVKIENDWVSTDGKTYSFDEFAMSYNQHPIEYLGVKFLRNVSQGDKRIVVVNGQILGASLRLPAKNSWLCNVSMGGSSNSAEVEKEEKEIVQLVNPILSKLGIVMYGIDTLVNDEGIRVLSEINTTSIGGLPQIAATKNEPLVEKAIDLIWEYYDKKTREYDS